MKTEKIKTIIISILFLGLIPIGLIGQTHQCFSFRLYEGFRNQMYSPETVTALYFNRQHAFNDFFSITEKKLELKALQEIYHLKQIHLLLSTGIIVPPSTKSRGFQIGLMCEENLYINIQSMPGESELLQVLVMGMDNPNDPVHIFPVRVSSASSGYFPFRFHLQKWYIGVLRPFKGDPAVENVDETFYYHLPTCAHIALQEFIIRKTQYINKDIKLNAAITPKGKIRSVRIIEGHPRLNRLALATTRRWRFFPSHFKKNIDITILYKFSLFYR